MRASGATTVRPSAYAAPARVRGSASALSSGTGACTGVTRRGYSAFHSRFGMPALRCLVGEMRQDGPVPDILERFARAHPTPRSEEHTSELQSLMRLSYAVFCLKKKQHPN